MKHPIHAWEIANGNGRNFTYRCRRCGATTVAGRPLPAPINRECQP